MKVLDHVHVVKDAEETVNAAFVTTEQGIIVIDTMRKPADGELFQAHISTNTAKPIRLVINTHFHSDHTFGNLAFAAPVLSTTTTRRLMHERTSARWKEITAGRLELPLPEITFDDAVYLHFGQYSFHIQEVNGHAEGLSVVYIPELKVLFTSDLLFLGRFPYMADADLQQWIEALRMLEDWDVELVIPGHGAPAEASVIRTQREWLEDFLATSQLLKGQEKDIRQISRQLIERYEIPEFRHEMLATVLEKL